MSVPFPISPSRLDVARCGLALKKYIDKEEPDTPEFEFTTFGKEAHDVIDNINRCGQVVDDPILDEIINQCVTADHEEIRRYAIKYMLSFPYDQLVCSEFKFGLDESYQPCDYDKAAFRGRIDSAVVEDEYTLCIVDNKSSWQIYNPDTMQLRFYAWAMSKFFPDFPNIRVSIYFLRYGHWEKTNFAFSNFANIEHSIAIAARQAWDTKLGVASPGKVCTYCRYVMSCPFTKSSYEHIGSYDDAVLAAQQYHVLSRQREVLGKKLRKFAEDSGSPIMLNDKEFYGYAETKRKKVDVGDVIHLSRQYPELLDILSVNITKFNRLPKDIRKEITIWYDIGAEFKHHIID